MKKIGVYLCCLVMLALFAFPACGDETTVEKVDQAELYINSGACAAVNVDYELSTRGGNGSGAVTYDITSGSDIATLTGNTLTFSAVGDVTVSAIKASDDAYKSAFSEEFTVTSYATLIEGLAQEPVSKLEEEYVASQYTTYSTITSEYMSGSYSISNPYIKVNPFGINPLSALVKFETSDPVKVSYKVNGDIPYEMGVEGFNTSHEIPVICLYGGTTNSVDIITETEGGTIATETIDIVVGTAPSIATFTKDTSYDTSDAEDYFIHICTNSTSYSNDGEGGGYWVDTNGVLRLYYTFGELNSEVRFDNETGSIFWAIRTMNDSKDNAGQVSSTSRGIAEMDYFGRIKNYYKLPYELHHGFDILDNGNLLVMSSSDSVYIEDSIIEIERGTGEIIKEFDFKYLMDMYRPTAASGSSTNKEVDWIHCNTASYDANTNALVVSSKEQSAIFSIDYDTKKINWIIGDHYNWTSSGLDDKLLTPIDADGNEMKAPTSASDAGKDGYFQFTHGQHTARVTDAGTITVLDNDYSSDGSDWGNYSRGVEYKVDAENMTIQQVWEFKGDEFDSNGNSTIYGKNISSVQEFHNGNRLIDFGSDTDSSGARTAKIYEVEMSDDGSSSSIVRKFTINDYVYRAARVYTAETVEAYDYSGGSILYDAHYYDEQFYDFTSLNMEYGCKLYARIQGDDLDASDYTAKCVITNDATNATVDTYSMSTYSSDDGMYFEMFDCDYDSNYKTLMGSEDDASWANGAYTMTYTAVKSGTTVADANVFVRNFTIANTTD